MSKENYRTLARSAPHGKGSDPASESLPFSLWRIPKAEPGVEAAIPGFLQWKEIPAHYVHHGKTTFDTGLELELLQDFYLIALDVFRQFPYPKSRSEQTAWLSLLSTENLEDAQALIREYPWLEEIYAEIAMLRQKPEEVLGMYSEALRILDQNTVKYMIDEMKKELADQSALIETLKTEKETALQEKDSVIQSLLDEIHTLKNQEANRS